MQSTSLKVSRIFFITGTSLLIRLTNINFFSLEFVSRQRHGWAVQLLFLKLLCVFSAGLCCCCVVCVVCVVCVWCVWCVCVCVVCVWCVCVCVCGVCVWCVWVWPHAHMCMPVHRNTHKKKRLARKTCIMILMLIAQQLWLLSFLNHFMDNLFHNFFSQAFFHRFP